MRSAKLTTANIMRFISLVFTVLFFTTASAQENSPYSRYGIGDLVPNHNILNRAMGGIAAGYSDFQSVNYINPASYSSIKRTIFDIGVESDTKTLKSIIPAEKFSATNSLFSYLQLGIPVKMRKANQKDIFWGLNIGIKPVSRINYKIERNGHIENGPDSLITVNEGSGGLNQVYVGTGVQIKRLSLGFNVGYMFGNNDFTTLSGIPNDSVSFFQSNIKKKTSLGGAFINGGIQYQVKLRDSLKRFTIGAYGNLEQSFKAKQDIVEETVVFDAVGNSYRVDSVFEKNNQRGTIVLPASVGVGFTYQQLNELAQPRWLFGVDFEFTNWKNYRYYNQTDKVQNSWKIRAGAQYFPIKANTPAKKYFNFVQYRAGIYYGPDYIRVGKTLPEYGFTFGAGFPLKIRRNSYETQYSMLNTAFEIGARGDKKSNLRENVFRVCIGLSLSDIWFSRAKYD